MSEAFGHGQTFAWGVTKLGSKNNCCYQTYNIHKATWFVNVKV